LLIWDSDQLQALEPTTGELLWSSPLVPRYGMSIAPPVISGDRMFVSGIGETAAMYRIEGEQPGVELLWSGRPKMALYAANCTPAFIGDYVYGADCGSGLFICFRASDGQRMWETLEPTAGGSGRKGHASAFIIRHENRALLLSETGDLILAQLNPQQYQELDRTPVIEPTGECFGRPVVWAYPAIAGGRLWVRNDQQLVCYQLTDAE
jgi:outer membrane protein assembly factor BamB